MSQHFQQHALALAAKQTPAAAVHDTLQVLRAQGAQDFERATWPSRKHEHWKYTPVQTLSRFEQSAWAAKTGLNAEQLQSLQLMTEATRLVFVDGQLDPALSDSLPSGMTLFSRADSAARAVIAAHLGKVLGTVDPSRRNLFASLNNAWTDDGLLIRVPRNVSLDKPVYVIAVNSSAATVSNLRLLIVLEQGAQAEVIEHFVSVEETGFVNALTEIYVGDNAQLHHTRLNLENENIHHVGAVHANLMRDARLKAFALAEGATLKRIDYQLNHCGQGASLDFDGVYLARHDQLVDYHSCIEHRVPHCTSQQVFRGIVGDRARAVFNGRIHIFEDAQKTLAEMNNRNLLTSSTAEVNTKPELEIYADDVKCAHGATISQLDETALYYLQSRGISPEQARMMLSFGFVNELLNSVPQESLRMALENWLRTRFTEDRSLVSDQPAASSAGA